MDNALLQLRPEGLYCPVGDFYIDPMPRRNSRIERAVITHGHADHARLGAGHYFCTAETEHILKQRLAKDLRTTCIEQGSTQHFGDAAVSLHPAGHVLGSAQVRVQHGEDVWVVTGDFKRDPDPTCAPFEPVRCDTLITEATFALPIYRWSPGDEVAQDIYDWWQGNARSGVTSVLFCYAFGKAQRVLAELGRLTGQSVFLHGAMTPLVRIYRELGVKMVAATALSERPKDTDLGKQLVLAPPSAAGSPWMRRFKRHATGFVSGWMQVRGNRRRRGYDRGFIMSDHADWPSLLKTIEDSQAQRVLATHGKTDVLVRYLREAGIDAAPLYLQRPEDTDDEAFY